MDYMYANRMALSRSETDVFINFAMRVPMFGEDGKISGERDVDHRDVVLTVDAAKALHELLSDLLNMDKPEE